jgi:hypothetical protein
MRTFFAASSEEETEVDCLCVVGGWLSTRVVWECLLVVYLPLILYTFAIH